MPIIKDEKTGENIVTGTESGEIIDNTSGGVQPGAKVESRITAGGAIGQITEEMIPEKGEPTKWYLRVLGEMTGYETGRTQYGPFVKLKGDFTVTDLRTGEVKQAKTAILPGLGESVVKRQADVTGFGTENGPRSIVFGMEIGLDWNKPDVKMVEGKEIVFKKYMWAIRPLGSTVESPIMRLTRELNARASQAALAGSTEPLMLDSSPTAALVEKNDEAPVEKNGKVPASTKAARK